MSLKRVAARARATCSVGILVGLCSVSIDRVSAQDEMSQAREAAIGILRNLELKKNKDVWQTQVSTWFKSQMTEAAFLANMTIVEAQLGGAGAGRELVQQNQADGDAKSGYHGRIFSFLFATTFPAAKVYESIVVVPESGTYKIAGFNFVPNPN